MSVNILHQYQNEGPNIFHYQDRRFRAWLKFLLYESPLFPLAHPTETVCEYEVQFHQRLDQERAQWNQYREAVEREMGELRRRLTEGKEEENLEDEMKKVGFSFCVTVFTYIVCVCECEAETCCALKNVLFQL